MTLLSVAKMKCKLEVLVNLILIYGCFTETTGQIIQIEDGLIEGRRVLSRSGVVFSGFFGIPFAEPPIGELRFIDPIPKQRWDGVLNCTVFGPMCMQFGVGVFGSEDCLQLNVFTKNLPLNGTVEQRPVIAFIHGGGWCCIPTVYRSSFKFCFSTKALLVEQQ